MKAFANLITKLVAAPFKLLGNLVPGGSDLDLEAIEFEPGEAELEPPEREKLSQIAAAMNERPVLQLQLDGGYNREVDMPAMQKIRVDEQIAAITGDLSDESDITRSVRKAREQLAGQQLPDLSLRELKDEYNVTDPETGKSSFDELAYSADLQAQLEAAQPVDELSLEALAQQRRDAMAAYLNSLNQLDAARFTTGKVVTVETSENGRIRVPLVVNAAQ
jgi:hypothetical protein